MDSENMDWLNKPVGVNIDPGDMRDFEDIRWSSDYVHGRIDMNLGELGKYDLTEDETYFLWWEICKSWGQLTPDMPQTVNDVARVLDLHPSTLRRWRRKKDYLRGLLDYSIIEMSASLPEVLAALTTGAKNGSIHHIREFMNVIERAQGKNDSLEDAFAESDIEPDVILRNVRKALGKKDD